MATMICDLCGRDGARVHRVTRSYGRGKDVFLIEGVPLVTCPNCMESYFTAETLQEIERIRLHRRQLAVEQTVAVAKYGKTA